MPKLSSIVSSIHSSTFSLPTSTVPPTPSSSAHAPTPTPTLLLPALPSHPTWLEKWSKVSSGTLSGYQIYGVEQRITDRDALLPVIVVFTGDQNDTISTESWVITGTSTTPSSVLNKEDAELWFKTRSLIRSSGARISELPQGNLPLTALPSLPPSLSIVLLPGGDYSSVTRQLYMNINIRRLGFGGRSALRIADIPQTQQLHFLTAFRLPIPSPSIPNQHNVTAIPFTDTVLEMIKVVQNALSLFGMGVVSLPGRVRSHSTGHGHGHAHGYHEEREVMGEEGIGREGESKFRLRVADGLLCDTTLSALSIFGVDIGEPILRYSAPSDHSALPPTLLSALLSIVISTRSKLIALGVNDVPRDPFDRRAKFLLACQSFQTQHRLSPVTPYLTRPLLSALQTIYARLKSSNPSTTSKVSRAFLNQLDKVDPHSNIPMHKHRSTEEVETIDLQELISESIEKGLAGGSIEILWGVDRREGRRERRAREKEERRDARVRIGLDGGDEETDVGGGATTLSEGEAGTVRGVLRGVRERAGRAGRKLGDGLGFTESTVPSTQGSPSLGSSTNKLAPSLFVTEPPPNSRRPSYDAGTDRERDSKPSANRLATLLSAAITSDRESRESRDPDSKSTTGLSPPAQLGSIGRSNTTLGLGPPPKPSLSRASSRRSMSEYQPPVSRPTTPEFVGQGPTSVPMGPVVSEGAAVPSRPIGMGLKSRRRRHSINLVQGAPEPFQILSRKRLEMDVNLRMLAYNLKQRERQLAEMAEALQIVSTSYGEAIDSLEGPLKERTAQLDKLEQAAISLTFHTESYSTSESPLAHLSTGSGKILYSQRALDAALAETYTSRGMLIGKVGQGGTYDVGTKALGRERAGMRRLVKSLQMWSEWLGYLTTRTKWHLRWKRSDAIEKTT